MLTDDGPLRIDVPRDRQGAFEPQIVGKHERRFTGFDDKIVALYARGLTVREVQARLQEMYAVGVSPDLISTVTVAVMAEVTAQQIRPLEPMYPVMFLQCLFQQTDKRFLGQGPRRFAFQPCPHQGCQRDMRE